MPPNYSFRIDDFLLSLDCSKTQILSFLPHDAVQSAVLLWQAVCSSVSVTLVCSHDVVLIIIT